MTELCELMVDAQRQAYGDGLDPDALHPWMWAVKGHYFTPFYNWPYTYGLLFGIGLYARYRDDPDRFRAGYDDLLSATGMEDAAGLGARFGIDVRDPAFWAASLDVIRERIQAFEELASAEAARLSRAQDEAANRSWSSGWAAEVVGHERAARHHRWHRPPRIRASEPRTSSAPRPRPRRAGSISVWGISTTCPDGDGSRRSPTSSPSTNSS